MTMTKDEIKFVNLTPHTIILCDAHRGNDVLAEFKPDPRGPVRLDEKTVLRASVPLAGTPFAVPIRRREFAQPCGLPEAEQGVLYIVSSVVADAAPHRKDLVCPGGFIRDSHGRVAGCSYFVQNS